MDRKRKRSDDLSNADASSGEDQDNWREVLDPSVRVLNRAKIAAFIQLNLLDPRILPSLILERADEDEAQIYEKATSEHNYLTGVSEHIRTLPITVNVLKTISEHIQRDTKSSADEPGKEEQRDLSQSSSSRTGYQEPRSIKSLQERHNSVKGYLLSVMILYCQKLHRMTKMPAQQQEDNSTIRQQLLQNIKPLHQKVACEDFANFMVDIETVLDQMRQDEEEGKYQIIADSVEDWYATTIDEIMKTLSECLKYDLNKKNTVQLQVYQNWLSCLSKLQPGHAHTSVPSDLTSWVSYSQQAQYLGLRPDPNPVDLTRMRYLDPQNPGRENLATSFQMVHSQPQAGRSSVNADLTCQTGNLDDDLALSEWFETVSMISAGLLTVADPEDTFERQFAKTSILETNQQPPIEPMQPPEDEILSDDNNIIILPPQQNLKQQNLNR